MTWTHTAPNQAPMRGSKPYNGPAESVDPVRDFFGSRTFFSEGPEGFVVQDIDGCYVLRHYGQKFGTDAVGQIRLVEWKYRDPFAVAVLDAAQGRTFGLLHEMLIASGDKRYCGFLVVTCNVPEPLTADARVFVQKVGDPKGTVWGGDDGWTKEEFAEQMEKPWRTHNQ